MTRRVKTFNVKTFSFFAAALLALCLLSVFRTAKNSFAAEPDVTGRGAGYSSVLYDANNGLPTSETNAIVQSEEGFIWLGGYSGLIRYDGNEFYRYDSSFGVASVVCLYVDSLNRLWIGTNDSGVAMLDGNDFTFFNRVDDLSSSVRSIAEDEDGNIMIATTMGLGYIENGDIKVINDPKISKEYICELVSGKDGTVYGVTLSGDFFTVKDKAVGNYYSAMNKGFPAINTVYPDDDNNGYVYLGDQESNVYYGRIEDDKTEFTEYSISPNKTVNSIRKFNGLLWICSDNGIGYFTQSGEYVRLYDLPMNNSIDHMMTDYEGNLWFTSSRQGVMKIVENRFVDISDLAGLDALVVNSTCMYGDDLYIATDKGLYIVDKAYEKKTNSATELLKNDRIRCIKKDSDERLWFCTYSENGLVRYDPKTDTLRTFTPSDGLASSRVRMIIELKDGKMAVATNGGLNLISGDEVVATYNEERGISNLEILCVEEGDDGKLYLGSDGGGIYVVEGNTVSRKGKTNGLKSEVILRIKKDPSEADFFWIITSNSLAYMRGGEIKTVNNFPYSNNFDLYFDVSGRLWILSSNGIYVVKREDLIKDDRIDYILYDTKCGLPGITTANSYSYIDDNGTLYISMSTGVCSVNIDQDTEMADNVKLAVPYVVADDKYIAVGENGTVRIPSSCKRVNVYANALTYSLNNPHLSYCLEGFDDEPITLTKQEMSYASYTNLAGGTYKFRLSLINTFTGEIEKTVTVTIIKDKAFYEQVWFWVFVAVILIAAVVGGFFLYSRSRTKKFMKKQAENKKLIGEMTKVFANCIDMKDAYTNGHSSRVAKYTAMFAERLGKSKDEVDEIYNIALLHDIGKISIPDNILNKPGKLTDEEYAVMKSHSSRGYSILKDITIDPSIALGAGYHHEKFDGTGYPSGLKGDEIPEVAQIIAVADTFDAMFSTRPYRKKLPLAQVAAEIKRCSGTQFNPKVVDVFLQLVEEGAFDAEDTAKITENNSDGGQAAPSPAN